MSNAELHAKDVREGYIDLVQAGGRVHVVKPDPETAGRWITVETVETLAEAVAYRAGYREAWTAAWYAADCPPDA